MKSLMNLLTFLDENWTYILIIASIVFGLYKKTIAWIKISEKSKVDTTILIVSNIILEKLAKAEEDWITYKKTGTIKRSKVINEIYEQYPILKKYMDQEYIIAQIDKLIDDGLVELEKTLKDMQNKSKETPVVSNNYYA